MTSIVTFDTISVRPWDKPQPDTNAVVSYPRPYVANPRLAVGLSKLSVAKGANIRAKATVADISKDKADFHATTWSNSTLYAAILSVLALAPANLQFSTGEHKRDLLADPKSPAATRINFDRPFATPPKVVVFFNYLDFGKDKGWRLKTSATNIDENGFTVNIDTWADTVLYAVQVAWVAYPEDKAHIFSTSVSTRDVRPWNKPQHTQSKAITFGSDVEFWKNPDVFVALNEIDMAPTGALRIKAYVDGVSQTGLTWHLDSWADTTLYSAGASIIAFNA